MNGGGAEREGDTEPEAGSRLWAVSTEPDAGLELMEWEIVTWAEVGRLTDWATQAPLKASILWSWWWKHLQKENWCTNKDSNKQYPLPGGGGLLTAKFEPFGHRRCKISWDLGGFLYVSRDSKAVL